MYDFKGKFFNTEIQFNFSSCIKRKHLNALSKFLSNVLSSVSIGYTSKPDSKQFTKLFISCADIEYLVFD